MEADPNQAAQRTFGIGARLAVDVGSRQYSVNLRDLGEPSGTAALFLHGFPTSGLDWCKIALGMGNARALIPDLLGFGYSDKPRIAYSYALQADAIVSLLAKLVVGRLSIVAHDYSVTIAQELLRRDQQGRLPFVIDRVALLNGGVYDYLHRDRRPHQALLIPYIGGLMSRCITPDKLTAGLNRISCRPDAWTAAEGEVHWRALSAHGGLGCLPRLVHYVSERSRHGPGWETAMEQAASRIGFIWGSDDPVSGAYVIGEVRTRMPTAEVIEISGAGHYPHWEAPDATRSALRAVLQLQ